MNSFRRYLLGTLAVGLVSSTVAFSDQVARSAPDIDLKNTDKALSTTPDEKPRPFRIVASGDAMMKAKLKNSCIYNQHLRFAEANAEVGMVFYYDPCNSEGLGAALGYTYTDLDWRGNPFFRQKHFDSVNASIGAFTERLQDWLIKSELSVNFDVNNFNWSDYITYDFLLWGRYQYCHNVGLHVGVYVETGMKVDRVFPIIGFDWKWNKFKLNAAFPVDMSLIYEINCNWTVDLIAQMFSSRHRAGKNAFVPRAIFAYRTAGLQLGLNYISGSWFKANVHAGYNGGGTLLLRTSIIITKSIIRLAEPVMSAVRPPYAFNVS